MDARRGDRWCRMAQSVREGAERHERQARRGALVPELIPAAMHEQGVRARQTLRERRLMLWWEG